MDVSFVDVDDGTRIAYEADAIVGGMVGGVGQRMLSSVSKRMAGEFFANVGNSIASGRPAARRCPGRGRSGRPLPQRLLLPPPGPGSSPRPRRRAWAPPPPTTS